MTRIELTGDYIGRSGSLHMVLLRGGLIPITTAFPVLDGETPEPGSSVRVLVEIDQDKDTQLAAQDRTVPLGS